MNRSAVLFVTFALALAGAAHGADMLNWDATRNRVDANIEKWTVPQLLERIAAVTGWQVFMDPAISNTVATKFRDKAPGDALPRLLGSLNYALAPNTNGAPRLYVFRTDKGDATQAIKPRHEEKEKRGRIENELVVTLKPGEKIEELAKKLGAKVAGCVDELNTYKLRFDDEAATQAAKDTLGKDPAVASVEDNFYVGRPETPMPLNAAGRPLGLDPGQIPASDYIIVGLVDTGVQGKEAGISDFLLPEINVAEPCPTPPSGMTHGTAMASTILRSVAAAKRGGSSAVRILPVNIYGCGETTSTFDVARGFYEAAKAGASLINASLGSDGDSTFLKNTVENVAGRGVDIYAAAGNEPVTTPTYPAAYSWVRAVTAGTGPKPENISPWANRGSFVDIIAPPSSVVNFSGQQQMVTGTSASTATASGVAVANKEATKKNP